MEWKELFDPRILTRGEDYCRRRLVDALSFDGRTLTASVAGSEDYDVTIMFDDDGPADMQCTCPYAESGEACKHMAAVLFAFDAVQDKQALTQTKKPSAEELIADADTALLRRFLCEAVRRDRSLRADLERFLCREAGTIDPDACRKHIRATIRHYEGRERFIDYDHAQEFIEDMERYLDEDIAGLIGQGRITEAFALCNDLFEAVAWVEMNEDGQLSEFGSAVIETWGRMIGLADDRQRAAMLEWFEKHLHGWDSDIIGPFVEEALFAYFDAPEELQGQAVDFVIVNNKNPMHDASGFMMARCYKKDDTEI